MSISVTCQCGVRFRAKDELAGRQAKCPKCGQPLTIPVPEGSEAAGGALSLDELMKLDAAGTALPDQRMPASQPTAGPEPQAHAQLTIGYMATLSDDQPGDLNMNRFQISLTFGWHKMIEGMKRIGGEG